MRGEIWSIPIWTLTFINLFLKTKLQLLWGMRFLGEKRILSLLTWKIMYSSGNKKFWGIIHIKTLSLTLTYILVTPWRQVTPRRHFSIINFATTPTQNPTGGGYSDVLGWKYILFCARKKLLELKSFWNTEVMNFFRKDTWKTWK